MQFKSYVVALATILLQPASFAAIAETHLSLSPALLLFDYTEFDTADAVLDSETGWIPGVQLQLDKQLESGLTLGLQFSLYDGNVEYNGQTLAGQPATSTSDATLIRLGAQISQPVTAATSLLLKTIHHEWQRNIRDTSNALGLYEEYRWWEISAGITSEVWLKDDQSVQLDAMLIRIVRPTLYIDLSRVDLGSANLDLGAEWGARLSLSWLKQYTPVVHYGIELFYETWDFGRSDIEATSGGSSSLFIVEPRSETRHSGLILHFGKAF